MKLGFTGTRRGMTDDQLDTLWSWVSFVKQEIDEIHFGLCRGADAQFYHMLLAAIPEVIVIGHPCNLTDQQLVLPCDELRPVKDPLDRNHDIVDESTFLIGAPGTYTNVLRSGTYSCLRYAAKQEAEFFMILPNGKISTEIEYE